MKTTEQIAAHVRGFYFGGNWTDVNLKFVLAGVTGEQATTRVGSFHTIAELVYHIDYFVAAVVKVLQGGSLDAHDKFSFDHPPITSDLDWQNLVETVLRNGETFAELVADLPEARLWDDFHDNKYGNYYRNFCGIIEHNHYHLGQIAMVKKLLAEAR
ncbi:MAG: DUF1572 domain-containing protein [Phycisphaerales bacterium]|nr:DUF1572 domain-containing protein [Phycisphaerales bacterium]